MKKLYTKKIFKYIILLTGYPLQQCKISHLEKLLSTSEGFNHFIPTIYQKTVKFGTENITQWTVDMEFYSRKHKRFVIAV